MPVAKQAPSYARLTFVLQRGYKLTKYEAVEWIHVHHRTAQRRLDQIHDEGHIYISGWKRPVGNYWIAQYCWGKGQDAPRPEPIPNNEVQRKSRNNPETRDVKLAKRRVARVIKKADKYAGNEIFNLIARRA